jgi:hypothetical protein
LPLNVIHSSARSAKFNRARGNCLSQRSVHLHVFELHQKFALAPSLSIVNVGGTFSFAKSLSTLLLPVGADACP